MKRMLIVSLIAMVLVGEALAQNNSVGIFGDPGGGNCNIFDAAPGLFSVYVVHGYPSEGGASGIRFKAAIPACASEVTWFSDEPLFILTTGNSQTGVTVSYGSGCLQQTIIPVLRINLYGNGVTPDCCLFQVQPFPQATQIDIVDCHGNVLAGYAREAYINPWSCDCTGWVPVEYESWGRIKALYQQ